MFSKIRIALGFALLVSVMFAVPAFAGGWAIITLDELPTNVVADEPVKVGFMVLQHGQTPMRDLEPTITLFLPKEKQVVVTAQPEGEPGHYTAMFTLPKEGDWEWSIKAFGMDQNMPTISVAAPGLIKTESQSMVEDRPAPEPIIPLLIVRAMAVGLGLAGLVFAFRRKSKFAVGLTAVCLVVGVGSFAAAPAVPEVEAQTNTSLEIANVSPIQEVEIGRQLFIAKGCIVCHANEKAATVNKTHLNSAPNLTKFSASPEALRMRLKDPKSVKSDTWMPDLNLSDAEIEALIAFINSN